MKTLIIVAHPSIEKSKVNKGWLQELEKHSHLYTVHNIYEVYPNGEIDILKEQRLIEEHKNIIFQFPIYWFNCPPLLKEWLDKVFTEGWAYGLNGNKLQNHNIALAVTAGISEKNYSRNGKYNYTLKEILTPFETTFNYINSNYKGFFAFYSAEFEATTKRIEDNTKKYIEFIDSM